MEERMITYNFDPKNTKAFILIPGYTGSFSAPMLTKLIEFLKKEKGIDVLGLDLDYRDDQLDVFSTSQQTLKKVVQDFKDEYPGKEIIIIAKSLGGALSLYNLQELRVDGLVIIGFPIVLGWPQRISLLGLKDPQIPEYSLEWSTKLKSITTSVQIINGSGDTLTDNVFLKKVSKKNRNIHVTIIPKAGHDLNNSETGESLWQETLPAVRRFLHGAK